MRIAVFILLGLAGCVQSQSTTERPGQLVVEHIERELGKLKCVGPITEWERSYWYKRSRTGDITRSIIQIDLRQAGFEEFRSRRYTHSAPPDKVLGIDDRECRSAFGSFDVRTGRVTMTTCEGNAG
jgi:hypothetical protein